MSIHTGSTGASMLAVSAILLLVTGGTLQAAEDPNRCDCWYKGYGEGTVAGDKEKAEGFCRGAGDTPDSVRTECDLRGQLSEWMDGCLWAANGKKKECPYSK